MKPEKGQIIKVYGATIWRSDILNFINTHGDLLQFIFEVKSRREVFKSLMRQSGSPLQISDDSGVPEATVYRALKDLAAKNLIESFMLVRNKRGGQRTRIWRLKVE